VDPFAVDQDSKAKEDFESAFASFKQARAAEAASGNGSNSTDVAKAFANFNTEFPPITELDRPDEDSESDRGGFDDDFAPASPPQQQQQPTTKPAESSRSASPVAVTKTSTPSPVLAKSSPAGSSSPPPVPPTTTAAEPATRYA
jgi:epidermal growth factor receptor substrate 15